MIGLDALLGGLLAGLIAIFGAWAAGKRKGRQAAETEAQAAGATAARIMQEKIDDATLADDADDARRLLARRDSRSR